jgi:hypothetical protein
VTHTSRRWDNCRSARSSLGAGRARRGGSVAGLRCTSGFCQTWQWLGEGSKCGAGRQRSISSPPYTEANARNPSARSPSVLAHHFTLTSMAFDLAIAVIGRCTFSTPSWKSAVTFELSASSGSVKLRRKVPMDRSMRWNFLF